MSIQNLCKLYRVNVLQFTLSEMSEKTGVNIKTISAFENERSNNINHLKIYYKVSTGEQQLILTHNIHDLMRG